MEAIGPFLGRTLVVVAHPDDETIGCGALLQRMRDPIVLFCTNGSPRDHYFWAKYGSREAYAEVRRQEASHALQVVGLTKFEFLPSSANCTSLFSDQDLFLAIPEAIHRIGEIFERYRPEALLSHAYEGGHPDHDTCCFITNVLARCHKLPALEFPLYHRSAEQMTYQQFLEPNGTEVLLDGTPEEVERKRQMMTAYASQACTLKQFNLAVEHFRPLADYDFSKPPHAGVLNYEAWQWPVSSAQLMTAFTACLERRAHPDPASPGPGVREVA